MAAYGVTAADFGRTNSSKKFMRTRDQKETDDDDAANTSAAATPAAADFLAGLRASVKADISARAPPKPQTRPAKKPKPSLPSVAAPILSQAPELAAPPANKTFLSKAERRAAKKRKRQEGPP